MYYTERDDPIVRFHQKHPEECPWLDPEDWKDEVARGEVIIYEVRGRDPALMPTPIEPRSGDDGRNGGRRDGVARP